MLNFTTGYLNHPEIRYFFCKNPLCGLWGAWVRRDLRFWCCFVNLTTVFWCIGLCRSHATLFCSILSSLSLFSHIFVCGVLVFVSVSLPLRRLPLLRPLLLFVNHHLSHTPPFTHHLSHTSLSTTIFHTQLCHTQLCHTQLCHTHTTLSIKSPSFTHNFFNHHLSHTIFHTQLCHTHTHTTLSHTIFHTQLCHPPYFTHKFAWQAWYLWQIRGTWRHRPSFCVAGVVEVALGGALGRCWSSGRRGTLRGRCGTWWHPPWFHAAGVALGDRRGTWWHPPSFHVAGVALGDIYLCFAWQGWDKFHLVARLVAVGRPGRRGSLRGRRGTRWHPPWFHVAGVALGDIYLRFAWEAWQKLLLVARLVAVGRPERRGTLRGRRGTKL